MGTGNDQVNQGLTFVPATGPWTAFLGSGNDRYVGSDGVDFVKGGSGIDSIDPGPGKTASTPDLATIGSLPAPSPSGPRPIPISAAPASTSSTTRSGPPRSSRPSSPPPAGQAARVTGSASSSGSPVGRGPNSILGLSSSGNAGDDTLTGGSGGDRITGGTGADTIRGFAGDDSLNSEKTGSRDTKLECSTGNDQAFIDLTDPFPVDLDQCELLDRRAVDEEPATVIVTGHARSDHGEVPIRLRCPRAVGRACGGGLTLAPKGAAAGPATDYRIGSGHSELVAVALGRRRSARPRGRSHGFAAIATSHEKGRHGPETGEAADQGPPVSRVSCQSTPKGGKGTPGCPCAATIVRLVHRLDRAQDHHC